MSQPRTSKYLFSLAVVLFPSFCLGQAVRGYERLSDRLNVTLSEGVLSICPLTDNAVRVKFFKDVDGRVPELVFTSNVRTPAFTISDSHSKLELRVTNIVVTLDKHDGNLSFEDSSGKFFLTEKAETRKLVPDSVMGEPCFVAEQSFDSPNDEYLFGLGQFQDGYYNVRNVTR